MNVFDTMYARVKKDVMEAEDKKIIAAISNEWVIEWTDNVGASRGEPFEVMSEGNYRLHKSLVLGESRGNDMRFDMMKEDMRPRTFRQCAAVIQHRGAPLFNIRIKHVPTGNIVPGDLV